MQLSPLKGEESLNPSPCGEGFVGRDSYAFRGEDNGFSHEFVPIMFQKNGKKKLQENHLIIIFLESKHVII